MRGFFKVADNLKLGRLYDSVLQVLSKIGIRIEDDNLLDQLSSRGAIVDKSSQIAKFPERVIEDIVELIKKDDQALQIEVDDELRQGIGGIQTYYYDWPKNEKSYRRGSSQYAQDRSGDGRDHLGCSSCH